jgi:hypothetical protein
MYLSKQVSLNSARILAEVAQPITNNLALKLTRPHEKPIACITIASFPTFWPGKSGYHFSIQPFHEKDAESSHHFSC